MLRHVARLLHGLLAVGLLLGLTPSAHAAASYDVTQVGKVTIQSIADGNGRQLNGTHDGREITGGFTPNAYIISTRVRYGIHIDDMSRLAEGDRITINQSSTGHFEVAAYSGGSVVNDQAGTPVFSIGWTRARHPHPAAGEPDGRHGPHVRVEPLHQLPRLRQP